MKKIAILTATRAEYGLLAPVIRKLNMEPEIDVRVVVTGMHLCREFGMTVDEIRQDGVHIDREIDIRIDSDTPAGISKTMSRALAGFADYFAENKPDALMVLGDRYETLAVCIAAMNERIPIIHLHGGEATLGAVDEAIRNAITKMSYLHFTATEEYRKRVIRMGEAPDRVFMSGAVGVENALGVERMSKGELEQSLGCELGDSFAVLTFHPVTLENNTAQNQIDELIKAMEKYPDITFLCTKANADVDGKIINESLRQCADTHRNVLLYDSLGVRRYLSALSYAEFVIGNSSSGIIEVPSFGIPTINIGDRQKGRIQAESVINCEPLFEDIADAIEKARSLQFRNYIRNISNPYGDGKASDVIVDVTKDFLLNDKFETQKKFYDI